MFGQKTPIEKELVRRSLELFGGWKEVTPGTYLAMGRRVAGSGAKAGEAVILAYRPFAERMQLSVFVHDGSYDLPDLVDRAASLKVGVLGQNPGGKAGGGAR